ncbi:MAG: alginate lyase family protein [Balneolales bacterium]
MIKFSFSAYLLLLSVAPTFAQQNSGNPPWKHPNLFIDQAEIEAVKTKVLAQEKPWSPAYEMLITDAEQALDSPAFSVVNQGPKGNSIYEYLTERPYCGWEPAESPCGGRCCDGPGMFYGADLIWNYKGWSPADKGDFLHWTKDITLEAANRRHKNNFENWRVAFVMAGASLLEDENLMSSAIGHFKENIDDQVNRDGAMIHELGRTNSLDYSLYAVLAMVQAAETAAHYGEDLYRYKNSDQRGLESVLDYHAPFASGMKSWPHQQITAYSGANTWVYEFGYARFRKPAYKAVLDHWERPMYDERNMGPVSLTHGLREESWPMHRIDPGPLAGSDGVKLADINGNGLLDLVTGFEEGGKSRIYLHPGQGMADQPWDHVTLPSPDVEDAVFVDLDDNGIMDVVTASEGNTNKILFHWAPDNVEDYLEADQWQSQSVPAVDGLSAWMFAVPADMDQRHGQDIIIGSKRKRDQEGQDRGFVGWLEAPEHPRDVTAWKFHSLTRAGWIMTIKLADMNEDGHQDILISDRKYSTQSGVRWLENPGPHTDAFYSTWSSHMIGVEEGEPMFLEWADINGDGLRDVIVPDLTRHLALFKQTRANGNRWEKYNVPYPAWAGSRGKAVAAGDLDLDSQADIVLSFEEDGRQASLSYEDYKASGKHSVIWGSYGGESAGWIFNKVSSLKGRKFDLVTLIDLDGDGDLDILTNDENEEGDGLGVVWYENPFSHKMPGN